MFKLTNNCHALPMHEELHLEQSIRNHCTKATHLLHHPGLCREEVNIGLYGIIVCFFFSYKRMVLLFFSVRGEED